jgi:hypothetical protein
MIVFGIFEHVCYSTGRTATRSRNLIDGGDKCTTLDLVSRILDILHSLRRKIRALYNGINSFRLDLRSEHENCLTEGEVTLEDVAQIATDHLASCILR